MLVEPAAADDVADASGRSRTCTTRPPRPCAAPALSEGGEALGAQAGGARLAELFHEAGFGDWNVVAGLRST